jgi:glutaryl-CoA dehydrogenase
MGGATTQLGISGASEQSRRYGYAGMSPMACGLVAMELYRGDGGLGVVLSVHADLAMPSVAMGGCVM